MLLNKYISILLLVFFATTVCAQNTTVSGVIQDSHTKEPVSFASVYFSTSGIGKLSDSTGRFSFTFSRGITDTLEISYTGYETFKQPINFSEKDSSFTIELQRGKAINEVLVRTKINKGLFLWRKIMSKKKLYNRYNLANFAYEAYNKLEVDLKNFKAEKAKKNFLLKPFAFVFDNIDSTSEKEPFLPAYLLESLSDYAYQKSKKKYFENVKASKTIGFNNESISKMLGVMNQNVNIYGNYVNIMDKDFIGPFNDNADDYYNFSVADTQVVNNKKIFHFVFKPKRAGQNTFEGEAWVLAQTYQIQKASLFLSKDANVNFVSRISIFQEFIPINDTVFFLNRDKFYADFKVLGKQSLTLIGRKSTSYKNIVINSDSISKLFETQSLEEVIKTEKAVNQVSDSTWNLLRHDSLSANEKSIYVTINKLLEMPKFQRLKTNLKFLGTGYRNVGNAEIGPWFNWISSNAWEGTRFRFDLGTNKGFHKKIYLHGYLAYGTKDKKLKGLAEAYWLIKKRENRFRLHAAYSKDIDNGISQVGDVSQDNIFSLAIRKPNISRKFLQLQDARFEIFNELGKGFSTELFFVHRKYMPLLNLPFINSNGQGQSFTNFEVALRLRFAYLEQFVEGDYFRYSLGSKYPVAEVMLAKGIPNIISSENDYTKISGSVRDKMKLSPYGTLSYKVHAGKVFGTLPFMFLENHPGNDIFYYNSGAYNLMTRFQYLSDNYAGINIEHNIGSGIFRFIPITRKLKWRQFWNVKTLWGSLSDANTALNYNSPKFETLNRTNYTEIGMGVDNIFKLLRVDFVWNLSGISTKSTTNSRFGVFGSFQLQF
ncbi:MAG: carboxypeptidase-like regulatory domain-containing protein [Rhizobacter sp.]|nr:carboxypeptidase-like regulatory domain-containing protein [Ferruginibacter sp.]